MTDKIIERLREGEDSEARDHICRQLADLIDQSDKGEIGIGDFTVELERLAKLSNEYLFNFPNL
jgi:hypothetical protein